MNKEVNFEIAKLLKDKGFDNESSHYYNEKGELLFDMHFPALQPTKQEIYFDAPTIAEVVMWLYKKHRIWVEANYLPNVEKFAYIAKPLDFKKPKEFASYKKYYDATKHFFSTQKYESPTEACEAAIKYTLENLI